MNETLNKTVQQSNEKIKQKQNFQIRKYVNFYINTLNSLCTLGKSFLDFLGKFLNIVEHFDGRRYNFRILFNLITGN